MEAKKSPKADLERKRGLFFQAGLILALAATLFAFEWKTYDAKKVEFDTREVDVVQEEMVEITQQTKPPPPVEAPPQTTTLINVVKDDALVEDDIVVDMGADVNMEIPVYVPVVAKEVEADVVEEEIFLVVENQPEFKGGEKARLEFLRDNIQYPQMARESGIQGTVYLSFVIEKDGSVTDINISRGIGGGCDEEAVRVLKLMPKWQPGKQRNKPVRVKFSMPIKFTLAG